MADGTPKGGLTEQEFDLRKRQVAIELFEQTKTFMQTDDLLNRAVIELVQAVTANVKANPKLFESQSSASIDDLIKQMRSATGQAGDKTGADISGGGVLGDIADFLHAIGDFIKGEKDFIMDIIRLIFCGCK
jgi:hypothetical protein